MCQPNLKPIICPCQILALTYLIKLNKTKKNLDCQITFQISLYSQKRSEWLKNRKKHLLERCPIEINIPSIQGLTLLHSSTSYTELQAYSKPQQSVVVFHFIVPQGGEDALSHFSFSPRH
jgi:hypothetical protein